MNMEKTVKSRHRKYDAQFKEGALKQIEHGQSVSSAARATRHERGQVKEIRKQLKQAEWERGIKKNFDHLQPPELKTIY
ncbi:MAG: hypothetical protein CRN43_02970, partial [Candidatus Nephrothrix sp. EaCA]